MLLQYRNGMIRNAAPEDAPLLCRWWNDGKILAHAGFPNGLHVDPTKLALELTADSDDTFRRLILEIDRCPVGEMSFRNKGGHIAEIGIKICEPSKQEKGYGTLFLKMLITTLFSSGYEKISLDTNANNARARHVYEKIGFQMLGIQIDSWKNQLGETQSSVDYELRKDQFIPLVF